MKGIYLCAFKALHPNADLIYQDKFEKRDLMGDCLEIDLTAYDYIIATPPCNYWSRANYRRNRSYYAISTMHLLPCLIYKLKRINKPFIIENVRNDSMFNKFKIYELANELNIYKYGRHTYFTNVNLTLDGVTQIQEKIQNTAQSKREGGVNVKNVIDKFLKTIGAFNYDK